MKLNADKLRKLTNNHEPITMNQNDIYIILDNVLDTYNIGAIFRLADAVAAKKVIICGSSETPPNHRIKKASINTTEVVEWSYCETAAKAINELRLQVNDIKVVAIEQSKKSIAYDKYNYQFPIALVVGHESEGIPQETLDLCDKVVEIPIFGVNISLNVMVSLAIVLYKALENLADN